jgi:hypothetical protein
MGKSGVKVRAYLNLVIVSQPKRRNWGNYSQARISRMGTEQQSRNRIEGSAESLLTTDGTDGHG